MNSSRSGKVTEYKSGHYYLTHVEWGDGHEEMEIHICSPQRLWHSCDPTQLNLAKQKFSEITNTLPLNEKTVSLLPVCSESGNLPPSPVGPTNVQEIMWGLYHVCLGFLKRRARR